ncbi:MAG TPA: sugar phosphate isomerase/epimerase family protein [Sumerlaeia bacterium]|nr:sugar phosphate isomerase/epimerase family protein [Sumerlaeia bacterium]
MSEAKITWAVFTKPWKMPLPELGGFVSGLGFDGIELPVRPGYQVQPDNMDRELPEAARVLAGFGVRICSVACPPAERAMAACAEAGVPIIRDGVVIGEEGYMATEAKVQKEYDRLAPLLDRYGVKLGVQNHCGGFVCNAMGLRHLIEKYDPKHIGAVLCLGHCALDGELPDMAIDIVWSHLAMIFLKNAYWRRANGPEAEFAEWDVYWTTGRQGLQSWPAVAEALKQRGYEGVINLNAEYTDEGSVNRLIAEDLAFAKSLFETSTAYARRKVAASIATGNEPASRQ